MGSKKSENSHNSHGASPGKIFIGGLAKDTTEESSVSYFERYGKITDAVIMKDRHTHRPRGFGFITYEDPSVVDQVVQETHIINGKQIEIKRTIPKGPAQANDFKTKKKKIYVREIPTSVAEGFGFLLFDSEKVVDNVLANGNMIDMEGTQVEIKKAEPKKDIVGPMILVVAMGDLLVAVMLVIEDSCHLAILVALVPIWEALAGDMVGVG